MTSLEEQSPEKLFELGLNYLEKSDVISAIAEFTNAIKLNPNYAKAYIYRAMCYRADDNYELCIADCNKVIQLKDLHDDNNRTICNNDEGSYERITFTSESDQLDFYAAQAHEERSLCYAMQKKYEPAFDDIDKAISLYESEEDKEGGYSIFLDIVIEAELKGDKSARDYFMNEIEHADSRGLLHSVIYSRLVETFESQRKEEDQIKALRAKAQREKKEALHEKEKEMLSFFTHTMRNALATAPQSLREAIDLLGGDVYEKDTKHYKAINKIASLFSTLSLTDCLIDTFKQSISDPQEFKQSWHNDHTGEATPKWVIASALRQSLNRIIFMSDTCELRKLLDNPETALIKVIRKSFIEEVLPLNVDSQGVDVFYAWTLKHISAIDVSIADSDKLNFGVNQIRYSLLFAITSELILNALKYWDGENRIQISWQLAEQGNYAFSVKNHCKANATSNLAGTHKGLAFIKRLVELLGDQAQFNCKSEDQLFIAELILNKALFDGEV